MLNYPKLPAQVSRQHLSRFFLIIFLTAKTAYGQPHDFESEPANVLGAIHRGRAVLEQTELKHSEKVSSYPEIQRLASGGIAIKNVEDYLWKDIALQLLNLKTGKIRFIKVMKIRDELLCLDCGFVLELEERPSGALWNGYNTAYAVKPAEWAVTGNKYTSYSSTTGQGEEIVYSPYSTALHKPKLVREGKKYLRHKIIQALRRIKTSKPNNVYLPILDKGDSWIIEAMERLALIEQSDPYEVLEFAKGNLRHNPFERVYTIMFLNQETAFSPTVSKANAVGLMQWTRGAWEKVIRKTYPWAGLPEFNAGTKDHTLSITASILLYNYNANELINEFGPEIITRWREPEHYLAASYNTGVGRVKRMLRQFKRSGPKKWRSELPQETYYFLKKLDAAIKHTKTNP